MQDASGLEGEKCGICMDIIIDRGVLDCCQHWYTSLKFSSVAIFLLEILPVSPTFFLINIIQKYSIILILV